MSEKKSPLEGLSESQRARLEKLRSEVSYDKITVSFSIENRDPHTGWKKSSFVSLTASRGHGAEVQHLNDETRAAGYSEDDYQIVHCLLSKRVVSDTYDDAARRKVITPDEYKRELPAIMNVYDRKLAKLLSQKDESDG